ncbi:hypothetical protein FB451DRAFT_1407453 [Mycena latifolia]|nr:hypothetical protein FB451DRAFT_1407453 [Mycena latifolia]
MADSPQSIVDLIWDRVLFFAMNTADRPGCAVDTDVQNQFVNTKRLQYMLVSKMFHRLGLPYLYRWPALRTQGQLRAFVNRLAGAPALGEHLRALNMQVCLSNLPQTEPPVFAHMPRLRRLVAEDDIYMSWAAFSALAETAGAALVEFTGFHVYRKVDTPAATDPAPFRHLTALRPADDTLRTALPALEVLHLESDGLCQLLAHMELLNLRRGDGCDASPFLIAHGGKLREAKVRTHDVSRFIAFCPRLVNLEMDVWLDPRVTSDIRFLEPHRALAKFIVCKDNAQPSTKAAEEAEWDRFIRLIDPVQYPALHEIQIAQCVWPATE